jgi:hypothetical protein
MQLNNRCLVDTKNDDFCMIIIYQFDYTESPHYKRYIILSSTEYRTHEEEKEFENIKVKEIAPELNIKSIIFAPIHNDHGYLHNKVFEISMNDFIALSKELRKLEEKANNSYIAVIEAYKLHMGLH